MFISYVPCLETHSQFTTMMTTLGTSNASTMLSRSNAWPSASDSRPVHAVIILTAHQFSISFTIEISHTVSSAPHISSLPLRCRCSHSWSLSCMIEEM